MFRAPVPTGPRAISVTMTVISTNKWVSACIKLVFLGTTARASSTKAPSTPPQISSSDLIITMYAVRIKYLKIITTQLRSLFAWAMKLYIMTLYHSLVLLLTNRGWVVILTQSLLITFLNVS